MRQRPGLRQRSPRPLAGFRGKGREKKRAQRGREGGEGRGGEVDSDAQLEQGRQLAKAGVKK